MTRSVLYYFDQDTFPGSSIGSSGWLLTSRLQVRVLPGEPIHTEAGHSSRVTQPSFFCGGRNARNCSSDTPLFISPTSNRRYSFPKFDSCPTGPMVYGEQHRAMYNPTFSLRSVTKPFLSDEYGFEAYYNCAVTPYSRRKHRCCHRSGRPASVDFLMPCVKR